MKPNFKSPYQLFINGKWKDASDGAVYDVFSPATGEKLASCAQATAADVDEAVVGAQKAFESWKKTSPAERAKVLTSIGDIINKNLEELAIIETLDNGKPIRESMNIDVPVAAEHYYYFSGAIQAEEGSAVMLDDQTLSLVLREPIGVVGQIVPWNFPLLIASWKIAPALASGCCVVIKPSSYTSLSLLRMAELIQEVVPPGVFNVITGSGSKAGEHMLKHPGFAKLAFTGSTEIGCRVADAAAEKLIPATLELGGKSANIYFDDCNFDKALDGLQMGILFNQGQVCAAGSRVFVQEGIYDKFVKAAAEAFNKIKVGDPLSSTTQMGALIYEDHLKDVLNYIEIGKREGARVIAGGERIMVGSFGKGFFLQPTLLAGVTNNMRVAQEEIFGPVAVITKFKTEEEAIRLANDSQYGLAGGVWTQDINRGIRVARAVETGRMWINMYNAVPAGAPFGGYKKSGIGRETHKVILEHYTQMKNIMISLAEGPSGFYPA
ncbi:aldehyde dehydrogenase family protein [Leadbettera azotonutricia]|uniref:Aldehyde dehydrogenase (NAD) family protein n=1 Tax=Leadbettera azotonutricia (strain ATCC BAA-888 / DSM 13862 / ZAS-9) TaxID=545695 RepID=F5YBX1_LEAAZ|nr:aldehyde dehydrogenase family protein [Leadbettera azotonutricia]AEF81908.1 aldehyde dehydrogenase (NAD) family protein [Leadbettera azotonutricia ZAS-9]